MPSAQRAARMEQQPAPTPPPVAKLDPDSSGIAYITVTDAAGRVLFRRAATPGEVEDALRSADAATSEGHAALDRILAERSIAEHAAMGEVPMDDFGVEGDTP